MPVSEQPLPLDTGVLISLAAATGSWEVLEFLGRTIVITRQVLNELRRGSPGAPGVKTVLPECASVWEGEIAVPPWLANVLDEGEASVIALALEKHWPEVGIDEAVGRSTAKTCELKLTGSLGLLIRAKRKGYSGTIAQAISEIRRCGVWIGGDVELAALRAAGELENEKRAFEAE